MVFASLRFPHFKYNMISDLFPLESEKANSQNLDSWKFGQPQPLFSTQTCCVLILQTWKNSWSHDSPLLGQQFLTHMISAWTTYSKDVCYTLDFRTKQEHFLKECQPKSTNCFVHMFLILVGHWYIIG